MRLRQGEVPGHPRGQLPALPGHGERESAHCSFVSKQLQNVTENLLILAVNILAVDIKLCVGNGALPTLYIVSKSVFSAL